MYSSVRPMTATTGKSVLALVAILSLVLSLFAIARPVLADHGGEHLNPDHVGTSWDDPGQNANCPAEDLAKITEGQVLWHFVLTSPSADSAQLTIEFESGGVIGPFTNADHPSETLHWWIIRDGPDTLVDAWTDIAGGNLNLSHICNKVEDVEGSIIVHKTDQTQADVAGAEFTVKDGDTVVGGPAETDASGRVCFDGLVVDETYSVTETAAPDGWLPADPDTQSVVAVEGSCSDRENDEPDATFTNTLLGSLLVLKTDDGEPAQPLEGAAFTITGPDGFEETASSDANGWFCLDGLTFGAEYTVTETDAPDGYVADTNNPQSHVIDDADDCATRTAAEPAPDLTFVNTEEEQPTGSITVVKELDCEACETRTIGYYFNTADQHEEETNALFDGLGGIEADGILFTNVDQVQQYRADDQNGTSDGQNGLSARGQLTLQYLAAALNVARNGEECDLASRVYNNPASPLDGMTVAEILAEADAAFDETSSFSDEDIKSALDEINNSSHEVENPLTCEGSESGTLDGVKFDLFLEADYPEGAPIASGTTGDDGAGTVVFDGLALDATYVLVESGFPEGMTCEIVDVVGEGFTFTLNQDGSVTIVLTANAADVTLTVVNECERDEEEEFGSLLIAKEDDAGASLGGATFEVDGTPVTDDDEDGFVCVDGLTLGDTVSVEETVAPAGYIGEEGALDVVILSTDDCATRLAGDPQADADITFVNVPDEDEEGEGLVEIDKLFCFTDGEASTEFFVFGPTPLPALDTLGQAEEELPEEGCWTEAVTFTITGGDLAEPLAVETDANGILEFELPASENAYVITEDLSGESAEFFVEDGEFTAIVVLNLVPEEEDAGLVKVIKLFCEGEAATVEFIVEGGDAPVPTISGCEVGDATFELGDLEITTEGGIALQIVSVGEYSFAETDPNEATYDGTIVVEEGEITTIIVINTFEEGEQPGGGGPGGETPNQGETPREGTQGGNPLPNTATPATTGSVPAALLALLMLAGLGAASYAVRAEAQRRR